MKIFDAHKNGKLSVDGEKITQETLGIVYTPGVAQVCERIAQDVEEARRYTTNMIAVVSDGTAVLGLGDIGPKLVYRLWKGKPYCSNNLLDSTRSP